jgi:ParB/Sulfiredoxin domain
MRTNRKIGKRRSSSDSYEDADGTRPSSTRICPVNAVALNHIKPHPRNPRTNSKKQIRQIADSIQAVGFAAPVLIDENGVLLAGHGRLEAAKILGLKRIPAVIIEGLSEGRKRALLLADNRIAQNAGWDRERRTAAPRHRRRGLARPAGRMVAAVRAAWSNIKLILTP